MGRVTRAAKEHLLSYSLHDAVNNKRVKWRRSQLLEASFLQQIKKGLWIQTRSTLRNFAIAEGVYYLASKFFSTANCNPYYFGLSNKKYIHLIVTYPVIEELFFRGFLQNSIWVVQEVATYLCHINSRSNKVARWLVSPSCRILVTHLVFASVHLDNAGGYVSTAGAVAQFVSILLSPSYSLLYEATDNIAVSITAHITNNLIVAAALRALEYN